MDLAIGDNAQSPYSVRKTSPCWLSPKYAPTPMYIHQDKVVTLKNDLPWRNDGFPIRCWNDGVARLTVSPDCCDRERSHGMAESFVKTFNSNYIHVNDVRDVQTVLTQLDGVPRLRRDTPAQRVHDAFTVEISPPSHQQKRCPVSRGIPTVRVDSQTEEIS